MQLSNSQMQVFRHFPEHAVTPSALAIGNFDGVHLGHQAVLRRLTATAAQNNLVSNVLTFEPHPREFFAPDNAPARLTAMREKLEMFAALGIQNTYVCPFDAAFAAMSAETFMQRILQQALNVQTLLVGEDFRFGAKRAGGIADLKQAGIDVIALPAIMVDGLRVSSTAVRQALANGDLQSAQALLGRPYGISGHVVHGDKLGRQLGYPTANIQMQHDNPPLTGIYAVKLCNLPGGDLPGVASLGVRPTMKQDGKPTLEVHVFDFDRDIYGAHVQVQFLQKIRDEAKFPDLETLKRQIALDEQAARNYFVNENK